MAQLRAVLEEAPRVFPSGEIWQPVGHRLAVATDEPLALSVNAGLGGEIHVFVVGYTQPSLSVSDGQGYGVKTPSPYESAFLSIYRMPTAAIQVRANVHEQLTSAVRGKGCVLVFAMAKQ